MMTEGFNQPFGQTLEQNNVKVLILCGLFAKENELEVIANSKRAVEFSANEFQRKLISGFREAGCAVEVISAPFIPPFPVGGRTAYFSGFCNEQSECRYVNFLNIWGIRNLSRSHALKRAVEAFSRESGEKIILAYAPHTPFLEAASYAKTIDPRIKTGLYVPDLPEYMNLSANRSVFYDLAKKIDISRMVSLMEGLDFFVLLTEHMKDALPVAEKPYLVFEGIVGVGEKPLLAEVEPSAENKLVVYTGKLDEKFGTRDMVDSFKFVSDPSVRFIICGKGDSEGYVQSAAERDARIKFLGQVTPDVAKLWQQKATVLVNPRPNSERYTKYSFPSKNIEYLFSGKPVVAYMLEGMPRVYKDFIYEIQEEGAASEQIAHAIKMALNDDTPSRSEAVEKFSSYVDRSLRADKIAKAIIDMATSGDR